MTLYKKSLSLFLLSSSLYADIVIWDDRGGGGEQHRWTDNSNWFGDTLPLSGSLASFGPVGDFREVFIDDTSPVASGLSFTDSYLVSATSTDWRYFVLTLSPTPGGTAIYFWNSTTIGTAQVHITDNAQILLGINTSSTITNGASIAASHKGLELVGPGALTLSGESFLGWDSTYVNIGDSVSITNSAASKIGSYAGTVTLSGSCVIVNDTQAQFADAGVGLIVTDSASITNSNYSQFGYNRVRAIISGSCNFVNDNSIMLPIVGNSTISGSAFIINRNNGQFSTFGGTLTIADAVVVNTGGSDLGKSMAVLTITGGASITNSGALSTIGQSTATVTLSGSCVIFNDDHATFGEFVDYMTLAGDSSITNTRTSLFASYIGELPFGNYRFTITGGSVYNDATSVIGPAPIQMSGGVIHNAGVMYTNDSSLFSGGSLSGTGQIYLAGSNILNMPITQGTVIVGYGGTMIDSEQNWPVPGTVLGDLYVNDTLSSNVVVSPMGSLFGIGTVIGTVDVRGVISPGGLVDLTDHLKISGDLIFENNSNLVITFDDGGHDLLTLPTGNLIIGQPVDLYVTAVNGYNEELDSFTIIELSAGTITGAFRVYGDQPLLQYTLRYATDSSRALGVAEGPNQVILDVSFLPMSSIAALTPNERAVAEALDTLNRHTNACLQGKMNIIGLLDTPTIKSILDDLQPSELKGEQIALEELSFIVNTELSEELYTFTRGVRPFIKAGYEHIGQNSYGQYSGFTTDAYYELAGLSSAKDPYQFIAALGAYEASTRYKNIASTSSSTTALASLGVAGFTGRWTFGLDTLFSYHFINTSRTIEYFDLIAHSSHQGYSLKGQFHADYQKVAAHLTLTSYDDLAYLLGVEGSYKETGAECLGLDTSGSYRNVLRNTLGIHLEETSTLELRPCLDLAYVFEQRWRGQDYNTTFVNTSVPMQIEGIASAKNYIKINFGLKGTKNGWDYGIKYNGQYGKRFKESGVSVNLDHSF